MLLLFPFFVFVLPMGLFIYALRRYLLPTLLTKWGKTITRQEAIKTTSDYVVLFIGITYLYILFESHPSDYIKAYLLLVALFAYSLFSIYKKPKKPVKSET